VRERAAARTVACRHARVSRLDSSSTIARSSFFCRPPLQRQFARQRPPPVALSPDVGAGRAGRAPVREARVRRPRRPNRSSPPLAEAFGLTFTLPTALKELYAAFDNVVLHIALRAPRGASVMHEGRNVVPDVHAVLDKMADFTYRLRGGDWKDHTGKRIRTSCMNSP